MALPKSSRETLSLSLQSEEASCEPLPPTACASGIRRAPGRPASQAAPRTLASGDEGLSPAAASVAHFAHVTHAAPVADNDALPKAAASSQGGPADPDLVETLGCSSRTVRSGDIVPLPLEAPASGAPRAAAGLVVADRYRLTEPIGQGASGEVWRARHVELNTEVAVKFLRLPGGDPDSARGAALRFRFEAQVSAQLGARSRHVVPVHDVGSDAFGPYLVMEHVRGRTLKEELSERGPLPASQVVEIVEQVAEALTVAHEAGIVHRDLKPSNLMLERRPQAEELGGAFDVRVTDFGVAKALDSELAPGLAVDRPDETTGGMLIGSPAYMSPEQLRGEPASIRSDLWGLGVVAYEAMVGRMPFSGRSIAELIVKISTQGFEPVSSLRPDVSPAVDAWFRRALDKNPARRFRSAAEMAKALRSAIEAIESLETPEATRPEVPRPRYQAPLWLKVAGLGLGVLVVASSPLGERQGAGRRAESVSAALLGEDLLTGGLCSAPEAAPQNPLACEATAHHPEAASAEAPEVEVEVESEPARPRRARPRVRPATDLPVRSAQSAAPSRIDPSEIL